MIMSKGIKNSFYYKRKIKDSPSGSKLSQEDVDSLRSLGYL